MSDMPNPMFVPDDFNVPAELVAEGFRLEPLGPQHNLADYDAWQSSIDHIRATPGLAAWSWPHPEMTADQNCGDLERHARDFADRSGFTYTVLDPADGQVIGCVYIYPQKDEPGAAQVKSWVRASRAELDAPLYRAVSDWLRADWPFSAVSYAER